jgi:hypothetical protein
VVRSVRLDGPVRAAGERAERIGPAGRAERGGTTEGATPSTEGRAGEYGEIAEGTFDGGTFEGWISTAGRYGHLTRPVPYLKSCRRGSETAGAASVFPRYPRRELHPRPEPQLAERRGDVRFHRALADA